MSVMLRTTNPASVDEIDPVKDRRPPYVGQLVLFHGRPGEARMGKLVAPAIVTTVEDDDHVELLIMYAADDSLMRWKIPRQTDQNRFNCWSFTEHDQEHYKPGPALATPPEPSHIRDLKEARDQIQELRNRLTELEKANKKGSK